MLLYFMFVKNRSILQKIKLGYTGSFLLILFIASIIFVNLIVIREWKARS
ncbi:MAG: hypothetical protein IEMM0007_0028 [bacterium]|nr:MAG: hypothetical protein IEMM0007_0028 [bacterium]